MNNYKKKFISIKAFFVIFLMSTILVSAFAIFTTVYALWDGVYILLVGDIVYIPVIAIAFAMLCKEVSVVKVYEDKLTFKSILQKEKVLYISQIKNIYEWTAIIPSLGGLKIYFFDTRDDAIGRFHINDKELIKTGVMKTGYPFKIAVNKKTQKIIRKFWYKPIVKVKIG